MAARVQQREREETSRSTAVEHYETHGVIIPGTQAEIAAYLARRRVE